MSRKGFWVIVTIMLNELKVLLLNKYYLQGLLISKW